jgi:DNA-binding response OmpR family regulator
VAEQKPMILLASRDAEGAADVAGALRDDDVDLVIALTSDEAEDVLLRTRPAVAVIDLQLEHSDSGLVLAHHARQIRPGLPILLLSDSRSRTGLELDRYRADARAWVEASTVVEKPVSVARVRGTLLRLLPRHDQSHRP